MASPLRWVAALVLAAEMLVLVWLAFAYYVVIEFGRTMAQFDGHDVEALTTSDYLWVTLPFLFVAVLNVFAIAYLLSRGRASVRGWFPWLCQAATVALLAVNAVAMALFSMMFAMPGVLDLAVMPGRWDAALGLLGATLAIWACLFALLGPLPDPQPLRSPLQPSRFDPFRHG